MFSTDYTVHLNSFNSRVQLILLVDLMMSSVSTLIGQSSHSYQVALIGISLSM